MRLNPPFLFTYLTDQRSKESLKVIYCHIFAYIIGCTKKKRFIVFQIYEGIINRQISRFQNIFTTVFDIAAQALIGLLSFCDHGMEEGKGGNIGSNLYHVLEKEVIYLSGSLSCMI